MDLNSVWEFTKKTISANILIAPSSFECFTSWKRNFFVSFSPFPCLIIFNWILMAVSHFFPTHCWLEDLTIQQLIENVIISLADWKPLSLNVNFVQSHWKGPWVLIALSNRTIQALVEEPGSQCSVHRYRCWRLQEYNHGFSALSKTCFLCSWIRPPKLH